MIITSCPQRKNSVKYDVRKRRTEKESERQVTSAWVTGAPFYVLKFLTIAALENTRDSVCPALNKSKINGDEDRVAAKPRPQPGATKSETKGERISSENKNTPVGATLFLDKLSAPASAGELQELRQSCDVRSVTFVQSHGVQPRGRSTWVANAAHGQKHDGCNAITVEPTVPRSR